MAEQYDAARPTYPSELFDDLVSLAGLESGDRLLEVGCATGKATRPLAERGFRIVCIELGESLAAHARRALAGLDVEVHRSAFEEWEGEPGSFDLVYAATAWHWIDPAVGYAKAHRLLRPGGHLALWAAHHGFPPGFDPFFTEIQDVYDAIGESHHEPCPPPPPDEVPDDSARIIESGHFGDVQVRRYVWEVAYDADTYLALLDTFSGHIAMEQAKREHLYGEIRRRLADRPDGLVRRHWLAILHVARRLDVRA